jgi:cysteine desulfurase
MDTPVYLDNQATTRVDPRVVQSMQPFWTDHYGNSGSTTHRFGWDAKAAVDEARGTIAAALNADPSEVIFTSGATESNNLALRGVAERAPADRRHLISIQTEHRAVLDPLDRLRRRGFELTLLPVQSADAGNAWGQVDPATLLANLRPDTLLVSVMLANNETGVIQPVAELARLCGQRGVLVHCDATQAVGKIPVDLQQLGVDLLSCSAHKLYGPKGIGALIVRRRRPPVRIMPLIDGGGQERGLRSGTMPVPLVVGFARAVSLCQAEMAADAARLGSLRERLWTGLQAAVPGCWLNGPRWSDSGDPCPRRLVHNLNLRFDGVEGAAVMLQSPEVAISSGSACTSASPDPSHVLRAMGLSDDQVRSSLRFGVGRFNSVDDIDFAVQAIAASVVKLRQLGGQSLGGPA